MMFAAVVRPKGSNNMFIGCTLGGLPMFGDKGIMEFMVEKAGEKHPELEFELREVQVQHQ